MNKTEWNYVTEQVKRDKSKDVFDSNHNMIQYLFAEGIVGQILKVVIISICMEIYMFCLYVQINTGVVDDFTIIPILQAVHVHRCKQRAVFACPETQPCQQSCMWIIRQCPTAIRPISASILCIGEQVYGYKSGSKYQGIKIVYLTTYVNIISRYSQAIQHYIIYINITSCPAISVANQFAMPSVDAAQLFVGYLIKYKLQFIIVDILLYQIPTTTHMPQYNQPNISPTVFCVLLFHLFLKQVHADICWVGDTCAPTDFCLSGSYKQFDVDGNLFCLYCDVNNCNSCSGPGPTCNSCDFRHGTSGNQCLPCIDSNCQMCYSDNSKCTYCGQGWRVTSADTCQRCTDTFCWECSSNDYTCSACSDGYGADNGDCVPCADPNCQVCSTNSGSCTRCDYGYGVKNNNCMACIDNNCLTCSSYNVDNCYSCPDGYGINNGQCQPCQDSHCSKCSTNKNQCTYCQYGFGLNTADSCTSCNNPCIDCQATNYTICYNCQDGYFLDNDICNPCGTNCLNCNSLTDCYECQVGYYSDLGTCTLCPDTCSQCFYSTAYAGPQCTLCISDLYNLTATSPVECVEICGDLIAAISPCDLQLGVQYDGCDDNCQVEYGFQCRKDSNNVSTCSYENQTELEILSLTRQPKSNSFILVLKVWPPLNVFRTSNNLIEVFVIRDPIFTVNSVEYRDGQIVMQVDFSEEYLDKEIIVEFIPEEAIDDRYYASVNSSAVKFVPLNFYSPFVFNSSSLIRVICYMVSFMGMIGILIGLVSKRLAGIEAMFVYQIAWVSMLWVNSYMHLPYKETFPLQFANGFRHTFVPNSEPQNATSRLLQAGNSGSLTVGPHAEQFSVDERMFVNNFNIFLILQMIPLLAYFIIFIVLKCYNRQKKKLEQGHQFEDILELNIKISKVSNVKETFAQCLLCFGLFNMISVTVYAFIFFSNLDNLNHTASLAMFGVVAAVYFLTFVLFCCDPDPFDYFRYAFKKTRTGMAFYYVYAPALIGTAVLVMMMPERTWAPIIPISAMLLYLIAYRPYRERNENIRSAFNMVVMISCLSLRVLLQFSKERKTVDNAFVLNFVNMLLLFAVMVVSYVALIYHIVYTCYLKPKEEKTDEEKVMLELQILNVKERMQQIQVEDTVFKRILEPRMNILEFSNNLLPNHDAVQEGKGFEDYTSVESSSRKIKKELEMERIDQPDIKDIAEEKRAKINELRINTELEGANLTKEQREENNKLIFAMDVMANENEFLKLKNADDFTKKMMEHKETKHKFSFIDSYNKI